MTSRQRGSEMLGYLDGSLAVLLDAMLARLDSMGVRVLTGHPATGLVIENGRAVGVTTPGGTFRGDQVLATIPADRLAALVEGTDGRFAASLRRIEHFGAVCTVLELAKPLGSHYWLNVADGGFPFGGVIEHTRLLSPETYDGRHIVYLSRYFERSNAIASLPPEKIAADMVDALRRIYPSLREQDVLASHVFRTLTAAVVCDLGFSSKVPGMRTPIPGLTYGGMVHVYPDERSCNNSIRVAAEALRVSGCDTSYVPRGSSLSGRIGC